jgi:hypothetical protein
MIIFGLNIILALSSNLYDTDFCRPTDLYDLLAEQAILFWHYQAICMIQTFVALQIYMIYWQSRLLNPVRIETRLAKN